MQNPPPFRRPALAMILLLAVGVGCFGSPFAATFPVTGTVTYNGKPVEGATVILIPTEPEGHSASGLTDQAGEFSVRTYQGPADQPQGAEAGEYHITVSKYESLKLPEGLEPEELMEAQKNAPKPKSLLPAKYGNPNSSGLQIMIDGQTSHQLTLDLKG